MLKIDITNITQNGLQCNINFSMLCRQRSSINQIISNELFLYITSVFYYFSGVRLHLQLMYPELGQIFLECGNVRSQAQIIMNLCSFGSLITHCHRLTI